MENTKERPTKKRQLSWRDLPAFCDAAATISAPAYAARRLPEIKALWKKSAQRSDELNDESILLSGGKKRSSRHLRRRATSHRSRKQYRSNLSSTNLITKEAISRRTFRKKKYHLQAIHEDWKLIRHDAAFLSGNDEKVYWTPNHVWHAKRFHIERLWNWNIPMLHNNRGPDAALRLVQEGKCLVQDVSWRVQPIWFRIRTNTTVELLNQIFQRIIPDFGIPDISAYNSYFIAGHGLFYEADDFPKGCQGPLEWIFSTRCLTQAESSRTDVLYAYFLVHPSLMGCIFESFTKITQNCDFIEGPYCFLEDGLSCIQLKGVNHKMVLEAALNSCDISNVVYTMQRNDTERDEQQEQILSLRGSKSVETHVVSIVLHRPRDPKNLCNMSANRASIYCSPEIATKLFHKLVHAGQCCAIGWAEESYLALECEPINLVFPRDYPDTPQGRRYWMDAESEWNRVRLYLESGGGRTKLRATYEYIDWCTLVPVEDKTSTANPVIVRGAFGLPFVETLSSCGHAVSQSMSSCKPRRKRRKELAEYLIYVPPLSASEASRYREFCSALSSSLTLPAILLCRISIEGKGIVMPGSTVYYKENSTAPLGYMTCGVFSSSRGRYQGLGFVSAKRLLEALQLAPADRSACTFLQADGTKSVGLVVVIETMGNKYRGALSLVL